ncbi:MAG: sodium/glutamate symporter [Xanthomonadales bacterium]|nr:sodium/glutamate symporter [Xanthomonadales bacterium]
MIEPQTTTLLIPALPSFTLAILLLFLGKGLTRRSRWLRRYSIPDAVVGGVLCAAVVAALYYLAGIEVGLGLDVRDQLLLYFFAAIGLNTDVRTLASGGRPLLVLVLLATVFMLMQNGLGMGVAGLFGMDPRAGLMTGSVSLIGGVGTTLAWAPYFTERLGIANATELGLAANMLGLVAACVIGGPVARHLMRRHRVRPSAGAELEIGALHRDERHLRIDYYGVLLAVFWLNLALMLGEGIGWLIGRTALNLPAFVGVLIAGIVLRGLGDLLPGKGRMWNWPSMQPGVALISDISLGLFLVMALMGLQLWLLAGVAVFIVTVISLQIALVIAFVVLVVFRAMGRDYDAVVICSGFGGIALGSTATAVANMTAVSRTYGSAPKAFIVVPLVCGFFIDLVNALVIGLLAG